MTTRSAVAGLSICLTLEEEGPSLSTKSPTWVRLTLSQLRSLSQNALHQLLLLTRSKEISLRFYRKSNLDTFSQLSPLVIRLCKGKP